MRDVNSDEVRAQATRVDESRTDVKKCLEWKGDNLFQLVYEEDRKGLLVFIEAELKEARRLSPLVDSYIKELETMKEIISKEDEHE